MKKKMKRYEDGGEIEFETKMGSNRSISDDIREKAMRAVAEGGQKDVAPIAKKTVRTTTTKLAMPDYSNEDLDRMGMNNDLKPAKSRMQPETDREEYSPWMREFRRNEAKAAAKTASKPIPTAKVNSEKTGFEQKKERALAGTSYKSGGSVKSSASKRADGCCIRGKTRA
jgi:hypothetical protein